MLDIIFVWHLDIGLDVALMRQLHYGFGFGLVDLLNTLALFYYWIWMAFGYWMLVSLPLLDIWMFLKMFIKLFSKLGLCFTKLL